MATQSSTRHIRIPVMALQGLPHPLRDLVEDQRFLHQYEPGETVKAKGTYGEEICYLVAGEASLVLRDDDGERLSVDKLGSGDVFGEVSFFTGLPWASDAELVADEQCFVLEIPPEEFERIMRTDPDFSVSLVKSLVRKIMRLDRSIFKSKHRRRALQSLISREEHVFPEYLMGDYVRRRLESRLEELANSDGPVLIIGESGVGKEGLAHAFFRMSRHCKEVFLPADLLGGGVTEGGGNGDSEDREREAELTEKHLRLFFGVEEPGEDGGIKETAGYVELCDEGTLLVRGVEQLTRVAQLKLLEALVTDSFRRQGGVRYHKAKLRLMGTTRLDPSEITLERHPLLFALLDRSIVIPPLRTRRKEIPLLVKRYLDKFSRELRRTVQRLPKETLRALVNYSWPGNDLELSSTLKRALLVSPEGIIRPEDLYFDVKKVEGAGKFNLLRFNFVKRWLTSPLYPAVLQSAATPFFFIVLAFLFLGPTDPMKNMAALFSWALGWPILIFGAFLWARFWCTLCPIGTVGRLAKRVMDLKRPFPTFLKTHSDFLVAGAVLGIIWMETATDIRNSPVILGVLLLTMVCSAIVFSVVYERQSWCQYLCGLGGMIGVWSKTSILELRADRNVCISQCGSNECFLGTESEEGCPFGHAGPRLHSNRLCTICGRCVKNCPYGAVNLNLRIPGRELWEPRRPATGTSFLVMGLIGGLISEMLTKTSFYAELTSSLVVPPMARFTVIFIFFILLVNVMLLAAAKLSSRIHQCAFDENYTRYGLALLPLTLGAYTAFHSYYLVTLGVHLPILIAHALGFESVGREAVSAPRTALEVFQFVLIIVGLVWSLFVMCRVGRTLDENPSRALRGALPHALLALLLTAGVLYTMRAYFSG